MIYSRGEAREYQLNIQVQDIWRLTERSKLVTTIVSTFTASYVHQWPTFFPDKPLELSSLPTFDGRAVQYPNARLLRDYMSWRQVDCMSRSYAKYITLNANVWIRSYQ